MAGLVVVEGLGSSLMGTNYYAVVSTCPNPDHDEHKHIGKSSAGWRFMFRWYPDERLDSVTRWHDWLIGKRIIDEYGADVDLGWLFDLVDQKRNDRPHRETRDYAPTRFKSRATADFYAGEFS